MIEACSLCGYNLNDVPDNYVCPKCEGYGDSSYVDSSCVEDEA